MNYQVLARKWRPRTFSEVVGQQHVLQALTNSLSMGRLHHAYLFSGTRGVGKTSIARLLARGLNCATGITATPCGQCDICQEIEQGRFVDLLEIDAASRTKVEDTRELLDNVQYAPARGRFKIYLIDEVHMLSRHSFNALLKTLEEPPAHVKFLLATTDPQKLPVTILSRCLQFHLKALDSALICQQLAKVAAAEAIPAEERALLLMARAAEGSMRDALSLTDQAIALGGGEINGDLVAQMLGVIEGDQPLLLLEALSRGEGALVMAQINHIASLGMGWESLLVELLTLLHRIALIQLLPVGSSEIAVQELQHEERLRELARTLPPADVQLYYQILLLGRKELAYAPDGRMGVEMSLLRALAFSPRPMQTESRVPFSVSAATESHTGVKSGLVAHASMGEACTPVPAPIAAMPQEEQKEEPATVSGASAALLQARMQIQQIQEKVQTKKSELAAKSVSQSATPTIQRLAGRAKSVRRAVGTTVTVSSAQSESAPEAQPAYRWQARNKAESVNQPPEVTPQTVRSLLEDEKSAQLVARLVKESTEQDPWSAQVARLELPKLVEQLALNAFMEQDQQDQAQICLHLRSSHRHLNKEANRVILEEALATIIGHTVSLVIIEDDTGQQRTPMEWRQALYEQKLAQARQSLTNDSQLQRLCELFEAELEEESVKPV